jgi:DNA-binding IclR family transcriptional regulator
MESSILTKAFGLLEALAGWPEGRGLAELAGEVGLTRPSAHRVLSALVGLGYVEKCRAGVYRQTQQTSRLLFGVQDRRLLDLGLPLLEDLHSRTRETVNLGVLQQTQVAYLRVIESTLPLRRVVEPNSLDPFYCTALGRAIVSQLPLERQEELLAGVQTELRTPATVTSKRELRRVLAETREQGYAHERDQTDLGVSCIAAPVFDENGVKAAISLSLPTTRAENALPRLIAMVRATAHRLSQRLKGAET